MQGDAGSWKVVLTWSWECMRVARAGWLKFHEPWLSCSGICFGRTAWSVRTVATRSLSHRPHRHRAACAGWFLPGASAPTCQSRAPAARFWGQWADGGDLSSCPVSESTILLVGSCWGPWWLTAVSLRTHGVCEGPGTKTFWFICIFCAKGFPRALGLLMFLQLICHALSFSWHSGFTLVEKL